MVFTEHNRIRVFQKFVANRAWDSNQIIQIHKDVRDLHYRRQSNGGVTASLTAMCSSKEGIDQLVSTYRYR